MKIREIVDYSGLTQKQFAYIYKIPIKTLESWLSDTKKPRNAYVFYLLERCVKHDKDNNEYLLRACERQAEDAKTVTDLGDIINNRFL